MVDGKDGQTERAAAGGGGGGGAEEDSQFHENMAEIMASYGPLYEPSTILGAECRPPTEQEVEDNGANANNGGTVDAPPSATMEDEEYYTQEYYKNREDYNKFTSQHVTAYQEVAVGSGRGLSNVTVELDATTGNPVEDEEVQSTLDKPLDEHLRRSAMGTASRPTSRPRPRVNDIQTTNMPIGKGGGVPAPRATEPKKKRERETATTTTKKKKSPATTSTRTTHVRPGRQILDDEEENTQYVEIDEPGKESTGGARPTAAAAAAARRKKKKEEEAAVKRRKKEEEEAAAKKKPAREIGKRTTSMMKDATEKKKRKKTEFENDPDYAAQGTSLPKSRQRGGQATPSRDEDDLYGNYYNTTGMGSRQPAQPARTRSVPALKRTVEKDPWLFVNTPNIQEMFLSRQEIEQFLTYVFTDDEDNQVSVIGHMKDKFCDMLTNTFVYISAGAVSRQEQKNAKIEAPVYNGTRHSAALAKIERIDDSKDDSPYPMVLDAGSQEIWPSIRLKCQMAGFSGFFRLDELDGNMNEVLDEDVTEIIEDIKNSGKVTFDGLDCNDMKDKVDDLLKYMPNLFRKTAESQLTNFLNKMKMGSRQDRRRAIAEQQFRYLKSEHKVPWMASRYCQKTSRYHSAEKRWELSDPKTCVINWKLEEALQSTIVERRRRDTTRNVSDVHRRGANGRVPTHQQQQRGTGLPNSLRQPAYGTDFLGRGGGRDFERKDSYGRGGHELKRTTSNDDYGQYQARGNPTHHNAPRTDRSMPSTVGDMRGAGNDAQKPSTSLYGGGQGGGGKAQPQQKSRFAWPSKRQESMKPKTTAAAAAKPREEMRDPNRQSSRPPSTSAPPQSFPTPMVTTSVRAEPEHQQQQRPEHSSRFAWKPNRSHSQQASRPPLPSDHPPPPPSEPPPLPSEPPPLPSEPPPPLSPLSPATGGVLPVLRMPPVGFGSLYSVAASGGPMITVADSLRALGVPLDAATSPADADGKDMETTS